MRLFASMILALAACASPAPTKAIGPGGGGVEPGGTEETDTTETVAFPAQATADDPAHRATLPACASPLASAMFDGARDVMWRGTVPAEYLATSRNIADATVLIDGPHIFPAFRELIASAQHNVSLQTYVWEVDTDPTNEILSGLVELAARRAEAGASTPVTVRILLDAGILGFGSDVVTIPRMIASIDALGLDPRHVTVEVAGYFHVAFGNLHVKTLVVDGRDAIITGANPQAAHNFDRPWRDSGYRLQGDVALSLLGDFDSAWHAGHLWTCGSDETKTVDQCIAKAEPLEYTVRRPAMEGECRTMMIATRASDADPTSNRTDNTQDQMLLAGWAAATSHIRVQTPNLNDDAAKGALIAAVKRGVTVDVILSKGFNDISESLPGQGGDNEMNVAMLYQELATAGVTGACDKLRIRWYSHDGVKAVSGNGMYASHAKYSSIDSTVAVVGTANMDTQSWNNSREVNVVVDDAALTTAWDAQLFESEFATAIPVAQCD